MTEECDATRALNALGEPTRRAIVERLASGPLSVAEIAAGMTVSRSAVSQHLRVLKEARLVREKPAGTRRIFRLAPAGLTAVRDWVDEQWRGLPDASDLPG